MCPTAGLLLCLHQHIRLAQKNIRGPVLLQLAAQRTLYLDRVERKLPHARWHIALTALAPHNKNFSAADLPEHAPSIAGQWFCPDQFGPYRLAEITGERAPQYKGIDN